MLLSERKIIVTGGPTREWIDPVRYISNESSGKMGAALAEAAAQICSRAVFIHGPIDPSLARGKKFSSAAVETTEDLLAAVLSELTDDSVLIMAAAPADYRPAFKNKDKIKKSGETLTIDLVKNPDILKIIAAKKNSGEYKNLFTVGFAAETIDLENYAIGKLKSKDLDMICLNDVSRKDAGFRSDDNEITVFMRDGRRIPISLMSKSDAAKKILLMIEGELIL